MIEWLTKVVKRRWENFCRTPFGCLVGLFLGRTFHGGGEPGTEELDLGIGVTLILLAMPGVLVSLLMFEKYGSLIRYLRGQKAYDPFSATVPDEYFFIVLSMVVTGAAVLWRWDALFLDRRDYMNLVPLPISLQRIFFGNLFAIVTLAGLLTFVVNAGSLVLYPIAVVGSQSSFFVLAQFAIGHTIAVFTASAFSFFAVLALVGVLISFLPFQAFRRISTLARFLLGIVLLLLLASSFTVPYWLTTIPVSEAHRVAILPPVSFLGVLRTAWGRGSDWFTAAMFRSALYAMGFAITAAAATYALSFRRLFVRIPEMQDAGPLPRIYRFVWPLEVLQQFTLRAPVERANYYFVARTLLRSDGHLQIVLGFAALGLVAAAETLISAPHVRYLLKGEWPSQEFLSLPFILAYCVVTGIRLAFEVPSDLQANWVFRYLIDRDQHGARATGRRVLLIFSLAWLAPLTFFATLPFWGWITALLHTLILISSTAVLVEVLVIRFRKLPFTCSHPPFQSHSALIFVAYLFGFFIFTDYIPAMEHWTLFNPWQTVWFIPLLGVILAGLFQYRKQMLGMDKQLIFEEPATSAFLITSD
jgi:hypothetical protein